MPGRYYFDSYALIGILSGSGNYEGFKLSEGLTTLLNLMEVQYYLHKEGIKEEEIKDTLNYMLPMCIGYSASDCFDAVKFRFKNKKRKLSYVDCLGYVLAKRRGITFVTGDKEFSDLPNVTFIRA
jgi:predicted nucleic acid-binding protein